MRHRETVTLGTHLRLADGIYHASVQTVQQRFLLEMNRNSRKLTDAKVRKRCTGAIHGAIKP